MHNIQRAEAALAENAALGRRVATLRRALEPLVRSGAA
jgi:hypothetical protein